MRKTKKSDDTETTFVQVALLQLFDAFEKDFDEHIERIYEEDMRERDHLERMGVFDTDSDQEID